VTIPDDSGVVVSRFAQVAERYCAVVDASTSLDKNDFLLQIYRLLPELVFEATCLPDLELNEHTDQEGEVSLRRNRSNVEMTDEQWGKLYNSLKEKLGDLNLYWQVFDPMKDSEAIRGSLADDIADIYRDLKEGVVLSQSHEAPVEEIVIDWRYGFYSHWGKHAMGAMRTIHFILEDSFMFGE
jgi:hypothetical protein